MLHLDLLVKMLMLSFCDIPELKTDERPIQMFCFVRQQQTPLGNLVTNVLMCN